jgi:hypothetical protein
MSNEVILSNNHDYQIEGFPMDKLAMSIGVAFCISVLLIIIAPLFYPETFSFSEDYAGNLNRIHSDSGEDNITARLLFILSTLLVSIFGTLFFVVFKSGLSISVAEKKIDKSRVEILGKFGMIFGISGILSYIFISMIPNDQFLFPDNRMIEDDLIPVLGLILITFGIILYSFIIYINQLYSNKLIIPSVITTIGSFFSILIISGVITPNEAFSMGFYNILLFSFFIWIIRYFALDALRGLIIVLMAIDHANHFIARKHPSGEYYRSPMPVYDDTLTFFTRFVTHLCAPGFFFLMAIGMVLFAESRRERGWSEIQIIKHFWIRGGILIVLQLLLINRAWELRPFFGMSYFGVLYALGATMIVGSLLLKVPIKYLIPLGLFFTLMQV